jgi:hypothetical protein
VFVATKHKKEKDAKNVSTTIIKEAILGIKQLLKNFTEHLSQDNHWGSPRIMASRTRAPPMLPLNNNYSIGNRGETKRDASQFC